ncbi:Kelch repeat-containing protein [Pontibacter pamirensis]|uniref:hypothetical protein n=1 Tax=Pontibacter pamirensis TaxID=2562824 RepID=UPI0013893DC4|nr:hypothetical protein [Pontibacter pamirensis]
MPPLVFSLGDKGYFLGGKRLWQYDAGQNTWEQKNDVPDALLHVQVPLVIEDEIYLVGFTGQVMRYVPATDTYSALAAYPGTDVAAGFVVNGKGMCMEADGTSWEYDPVKDSWQQKASLPPSIISMRGFSLNGYGYVLGDLNNAAYNFNQPIKVWRYNPAADQWHGLEEGYPGNGVYEINAISLEGRAIIGLGYNNGDYLATDIWRLD